MNNIIVLGIEDVNGKNAVVAKPLKKVEDDSNTIETVA
jgi:hypothetical protein